MATQYQLSQIARHDAFRARVEYLMVKAAVAQLNAASPTEADKLLGQRILDGAEPTGQWALAALTNPTIAAGAHAEDGSTIVEGDLEFAINSLWSAFRI
jgi:hypothetical protein